MRPTIPMSQVAQRRMRVGAVKSPLLALDGAMASQDLCITVNFSHHIDHFFRYCKAEKGREILTFSPKIRPGIQHFKGAIL